MHNIVFKIKLKIQIYLFFAEIKFQHKKKNKLIFLSLHFSYPVFSFPFDIEIFQGMCSLLRAECKNYVISGIEQCSNQLRMSFHMGSLPRKAYQDLLESSVSTEVRLGFHRQLKLFASKRFKE